MITYPKITPELTFDNSVPKNKKPRETGIQKTKVVSYHKTINTGRMAHKVLIYRFFRIFSNGTVQVIDLNQLTMREQRSFGGKPLNIVESNKREWDSAYSIVIGNQENKYKSK